MKLTESQLSLIALSLDMAHEKFSKNAKQLERINGYARMREQFECQAHEARELSNVFDNAKYVDAEEFGTLEVRLNRASLTPKHTPGPWRIDRETFNNDNHDDKFCAIVNESESWVVAEVCGDVPHPQSEANAVLISTAPELLEAARLVWEYLCDMDELIPTSERARRDTLLQKAIYKAEGLGV